MYKSNNLTNSYARLKTKHLSCQGRCKEDLHIFGEAEELNYKTHCQHCGIELFYPWNEDGSL